jgi:Ca-activated chloride channel family protein
VILATDGDFNVGVSSNSELVRMIEEKRETGIFLTVLGFGQGNYKDARMEQLADKGNGNYAYIDDIHEARKVLITEMGGTLLTIAKDVKIQIEFNPVKVKSYRLIGYENRMLRKKDFDDDRKDAGELGAGHSVTALYEIVPAGENIAAESDPKYVAVAVKPEARETDELLTVRFRYKRPDEEESRLIEQTLADADVAFADAPEDVRFAAAVASFGMLLRGSEFKGNATLASVLEIAGGARGEDEHGYRAEFVRIVETCQSLGRGR